jgi:hypothetical protein
MKVAARLKKLEATAGKSRRCAWCRLHLRQLHPPSEEDDDTTPHPGCVLRACPECGTKYSQPIATDDGSTLTKAAVIVQRATEDDFFTDARCYAAKLWLKYSMCRDRESLDRYLERRRKIEADKKRKETPAQKLRAALLMEAEADRVSRKRAMIAKYGNRFPELSALQTRLLVVVADEPRAGTTLEDIANGWRAWAELERVMFGEPCPDTTEKIEEFELKIAVKVEERERLKAEIERARVESERRREEERRMIDERMGRAPRQPAALVVEPDEDSTTPSRAAWRASLEPVEIPPETERRSVRFKDGSRGYADDPPDATCVVGGSLHMEVGVASYAPDPNDPTAGMKLEDVLAVARGSR